MRFNSGLVSLRLGDAELTFAALLSVGAWSAVCVLEWPALSWSFPSLLQPICSAISPFLVRCVCVSCPCKAVTGGSDLGSVLIKGSCASVRFSLCSPNSSASGLVSVCKCKSFKSYLWSSSAMLLKDANCFSLKRVMKAVRCSNVFEGASRQEFQLCCWYFAWRLLGFRLAFSLLCHLVASC